MKLNKMVWAILFSFICFACGSSSSGPSSAAPRVHGVALFKVDEFGFKTETLSFTIGDLANLEVYATDPDLDMQTLYFEEYWLPNPDEYHLTGEMILPSQSGPDMTYFLIEPIEITGPAGNYRMCFWIVDKVGNESNEFCVNYVANS